MSISVTKSVTSMLVGIAQATHELPGVDTPVYALLSAGTGDDPRKPQITLAHLLSMTSGLDCRPDGGEIPAAAECCAARHLAAVHAGPADRSRSRHRCTNYCGGNSRKVVSAVLTKTTGTSAIRIRPPGTVRATRHHARVVVHRRGPRIAWLGRSHASAPRHGEARLSLAAQWEVGEQAVVRQKYLGRGANEPCERAARHRIRYGMWLYPGHTPVDFRGQWLISDSASTVIPSLDMVEVTTGGGFDANEVCQDDCAAPKSDGALAANPEAIHALLRSWPKQQHALSREPVHAPQTQPVTRDRRPPYR